MDFPYLTTTLVNVVLSFNILIQSRAFRVLMQVNREKFSHMKSFILVTLYKVGLPTVIGEKELLWHKHTLNFGSIFKRPTAPL